MRTDVKAYPQVDKMPLEAVVAESIPKHILKKWNASKSIAQEDFKVDKVKRAEEKASFELIKKIEKAQFYN